jgi:hypothetical protein
MLVTILLHPVALHHLRQPAWRKALLVTIHAAVEHLNKSIQPQAQPSSHANYQPY